MHGFMGLYRVECVILRPLIPPVIYPPLLNSRGVHNCGDADSTTFLCRTDVWFQTPERRRGYWDIPRAAVTCEPPNYRQALRQTKFVLSG